jgi:hypothetical protein
MIVTIKKTGVCCTNNVKTVKLDTLYKNCKFNKPSDFSKRATWEDGVNWVSLYAKDSGRAGSENKYELPPPVDNTLYFGQMVIIKHTGNDPTDENIISITKEEWSKIYDKYMGGFEDLGSDDTEDSEEEEIPDHLKTSDGYMKDGFVVSEEDDNDEDSKEDEDEEASTVSTDCSGDEYDDKDSELSEDDYNY